MSLTIRNLHEADTEIYRELREQSLLESPYAFSESLEDAMEQDAFMRSASSPDSYVLGAFSTDGKLVGITTFKRDNRAKALHKSMIHVMYTLPEMRGQGVGKRLLREVIDRAHQMKGLEQIHLWVLHHGGNSAAAFYTKNGFQSQGTIVKNDLKINGVYVDAEYMVLYLK
jgi:GNAT superfamily N-acetyltransferase